MGVRWVDIGPFDCSYRSMFLYRSIFVFIRFGLDSPLTHIGRIAAMTKTVTFGVVHMTVAFTVAYLMTGDVLVGGAIALVEPAINTVAYFFHEKTWDWVRSGGARQVAMRSLA